MADILKLCPFCGDNPIELCEYDETNGADNVQVGCHDPQCLGYMKMDFASCHESAEFLAELKTIWNTRPIEDVLLEALEEIEAQQIIGPGTYSAAYLTMILSMRKTARSAIAKAKGKS